MAKKRTPIDLSKFTKFELEADELLAESGPLTSDPGHVDTDDLLEGIDDVLDSCRVVVNTESYEDLAITPRPMEIDRPPIPGRGRPKGLGDIAPVILGGERPLL